MSSTTSARRHARAQRLVRQRAHGEQPRRSAECESLESRQLLTTYSFTIPSGHSVAFLQEVSGALGRVRVRLDDPVTGTVAHTFTNTTGMDLVNAGTNANFLFVDQVPAASKPTADAQGDNGIKVVAGSNGHLKIEAAADDEMIRITESTARTSPTRATARA